MWRSPRKRSRSKRKILRRRNDDGPSDDDSGAAEPRDLEEDRGDPGRRRLHLGEARGLEAGAPREVHPEEGGREGPQETRHGPRGSEAGAEAREGQARGPRPEALGEGGRGGAGSAAHNPREGAAALGGRTRETPPGEGERAMGPPACRGRALAGTPWTQAQQET